MYDKWQSWLSTKWILLKQINVSFHSTEVQQKEKVWSYIQFIKAVKNLKKIQYEAVKNKYMCAHYTY